MAFFIFCVEGKEGEDGYCHSKKKRKKNSICGRIESKVETKRHVAPERLFRWGNPPTIPHTNTNAQG